MLASGLYNPVPVAYRSHTPTLLTHDQFDPQAEGTGAIGAALFFIIIARLLPLSPAPAVLRSALLYLFGSHNHSGGCMAATSGSGSVSVRSMLPILGASTIGTAIEWYDFFWYSFLAATVFPKLFFPMLDPVAGTIAAKEA